MVLAFLRDNRVDQERKRADRYQEEASSAKAEAKSAQDDAKWWREKAERAEAELASLRSQFQEGDVLARLRRLEERYGVDDAENRASD